MKMKKLFKKDFALTKEGRGCYEVEQIDLLPFDKDGNITLRQLFDCLPIKDFVWVFTHHCGLSDEELEAFTRHVIFFIIEQYNKEDSPKDKILHYLELVYAYDAAVHVADFAAYWGASVSASSSAADFAAYSAASCAADSAAYRSPYSATYSAAAYSTAIKASYWTEQHRKMIENYVFNKKK